MNWESAGHVVKGLYVAVEKPVYNRVNDQVVEVTQPGAVRFRIGQNGRQFDLRLQRSDRGLYVEKTSLGTLSDAKLAEHFRNWVYGPALMELLARAARECPDFDLEIKEGICCA